jgi:hypothetical protein
LNRGGAYEPIENFAGFEDVDPTFRGFYTDAVPGEWMMQFRADTQIMIAIDGVGWVPYTLSELNGATINYAWDIVDGFSPAGTWLVSPYGQPGSSGGVYPPGITWQDLVGST